VKIIKKRLYESEGLSATVRWDETCECVQSFDGTTWVDNPIADPRYNPANLAPVNSEADPRCSAAFGMRNKIESIMQAFFEASALIDAANAILALITVTVPGVGLIWRVIFAVVEALYAIGSAALVIAFTEEAYDELQCIFFANISEDGQMSAAQLSDINTQICEDMDVTICAAMGLLLNMLGWVGMSNAGAQFAEVGDCSECVIPWCFNWDFTVAQGAWNGFDFPIPAIYSAGVGWTSQQQSGGTYCNIILNTDTDTQFTYFEATIEITGAYEGSGSGVWLAYEQGGSYGTFTSSTYDPPTGVSTISFLGDFSNVAKLWVLAQINGLTSMKILSVQVRGIGVNPFGDDNC